MTQATKTINIAMIAMKITAQIPNILSIIRIVLSCLILPIAGKPIALFTVLVICGISDILDGFIARRYHLETKFGAHLDSWADFIFYWIVVIYLVLHQLGVIRDNIFLLAVIIVVRLMALLACWIRNRKIYILHTIGNKISGMLVFVIIGVIVLAPRSAIIPMLLVVILISAIEELAIMIFIKSPDNNIKSILVRQRSQIPGGPSYE